MFNNNSPSKRNNISMSNGVEGVFNLDNDGVSQLTYPNEDGMYFNPHDIKANQQNTNNRVTTTNTNYQNNIYDPVIIILFIKIFILE